VAEIIEYNWQKWCNIQVAQLQMFPLGDLLLLKKGNK